jgi:hypothetical protein
LRKKKKKKALAGRLWLTPVFLDTQEAEIRRSSMKTYLEKTHHKKWAGRVAQGVGPEFKP